MLRTHAHIHIHVHIHFLCHWGTVNESRASSKTNNKKLESNRVDTALFLSPWLLHLISTQHMPHVKFYDDIIHRCLTLHPTVWLTLAFLSRSSRTTSTWPRSHAQCNRHKPFHITCHQLVEQPLQRTSTSTWSSVECTMSGSVSSKWHNLEEFPSLHQSNAVFSSSLQWDRIWN